MVSVRVEFIKVKKDNREIATTVDNVISARAEASVELAVNGTATATNLRPAVPSTCDAVRLTAIGGPIYAEWGEDPTASSGNGIRLVADQPEVIYMKRALKMSFVLAS